MSYRTQVREAMQKATDEGANVRVAKGPPQEGQMPPGMGMDGDTGGMPQSDGPNGPANRQIPKDHKYDPESLKPMAKMLWAMSVSLGHALQAYRLFNRVKSSTVSPDGMLGGRGYIMRVADIRSKIYEAVEALSAVSDTVHDEINAPHWKPKIGELSEEDFSSIDRLIGESENMLDHPDEEVEEDEEEVEKKGNPSSSWVKKMKGDKDKNGPASDLPGGGDSAPSRGKKPGEDNSGSGSKSKTKMASVYDRRAFEARVADRIVQDIFANSSVNPNTLGGPRVQHLDRADTDQTGPFGSVNQDEPKDPKDDWSTDEGVSGEPMSQDRGNQPAYQWDGGREAAPQEPQAASGMPTDHTPSEGFDWGIGRGNGNDAHGQGAKNPGGGSAYNDQGDKGVYGPRAELPHDPGGKMHDREEGDTTKTVENAINPVMRQARERLRAIQSVFIGPEDPGGARSGLPDEDAENGVARADYYTGPKDNDQDTITGPTENPVMGGETAESELPESSPPSPPRPLYHRPLHDNEFMFAQTALPGDDTAVNESFDKDLMDTAYRYERQDEPYVKWDDTTPNMRPDWMSQRDDQGPYAKPGN